MHATLATSHRRPRYRRAWALLPALLGLALTATAGAGSYPLVLVQGGSQVLHFERMTRVAVADPTIADVAVTSLNDLMVVGKAPGRVMLYVWDNQGQHDYAIVVKPAQQAQEAERQLGVIFENNFTYTTLDNSTLLMKGSVANQERQDDVDKVAKQVAQDLGIHLVAVYLRPDLAESAAQRQARVLHQLLGDKYQLIVWDDHTILVRGVVANGVEFKELDALIKAGNTGGVVVSNLVTIGSPTSPAPVAEIAAAVGDNLRVYALEGRTVVVEGEVRSAAEKDRVDKLLAAFADRADVVNLVQVQAKPGLPLNEKRRLLQEAVGNLLQVRTAADQALVVEGNVPDDVALKNVQQEVDLFKADTTVLNLVKIVAPQKRQILVKTRVLDLDRGKAKTLGFSYQQSGQSVDNTATFNIGRDVLQPQLVGGFQVTLHALEEANLAKVLAEPNMLINDGESGKILVGGEVPIPVPQLGSATTGTSGVTITIEYKQFGVIMEITPQVIANDRLRIKLAVEVSDIDPSLALTISGFSVPGFRTRREETVLDVASGETFAIGGLLQTTDSKTVEKLPVLGDLPILGSLFRSTEFKRSTTELVILLTPQLLAEADNAVRGEATTVGVNRVAPPLAHDVQPNPNAQ
jgi:Flp pilus assembly secretin CpaC